jgi:hypothetical protein
MNQRSKSNDVAEPPIASQLGVSSGEVYTHFAGPGGIVNRLEGSRQFGLPASDMEHVSRDLHGED